MKKKRNLVIRLCKIMNSTEKTRQACPFFIADKGKGIAFEIENFNFIQICKVKLKHNHSKLTGRNTSSFAAS